MILLVIIMSLTLIIGKTRTQLSTVPGAINVRILSLIPVDSKTYIIPEQPHFLPGTIQLQNSARHFADRLESSAIGYDDLYLRPPTLKNQPNLRHFIPEKSLERTSRPVITMNTSIERINTVKDLVIMNPNNENGKNQSTVVEKTDSSVTSEVTTLGTTNTARDQVPAVIQNGPSGEKPKVNGSKEMDDTGKPTSPTIIDKATGVEVTLDERANFDGDKCPTGYVRFNGMCVKKD